MTIAVAGATGHLGRLVVEALIGRGVEPSSIVAAVRSPEKAAGLLTRGVQVREADFDRPETLPVAFAGVDRLLLISSNAVGNRVGQHVAAIEAAKAAGVQLIAYTSVLRADTTPILLAAEHKATEEALAASGVAYTFLRNGWYIENYTAQLPTVRTTGAFLGSAGEGRIAGATRLDYAEAAAAVLTADDVRPVYELGGDQPFTLAELAAEVSRQSGETIGYHDVPADELVTILTGAGVPEGFARILADTDVHIRENGVLDNPGSDLRDLIGRPTTPLADAVADALKA
ncbi:NmrA family transcriptional regulator [Actinoplanes sp. SE50]|uniref:SDR family oxidoreductase n=1 Tax=unclassified Actinoplanes TaxID=2626549 RepID=UPI00023ED5B6|nr:MULTISPECIES: SDR family oxidoreductase [unclassified Actinoplanes]AEV83389.1 Prestalk A differentiation protein A [Actinoplanes sp. SE50/110]ATO81782.1 NmrA family transcriptional regulator [Actinoplanes sp. SE50]SLL99190.1 NAD(P)-dependent oxidoreductase [Actinoplanes sp. SE50/110]